MSQPPARYSWSRWQALDRAAWLYLLHAALLTASLALTYVVFNLAVEALDAPPLRLAGLELELLGVLGSLSVLTALLLALPMLWLVTRIGFWLPLVLNALLQLSSTLIIALVPQPVPLLGAAMLTGVGGVLFQISSVPFMTRLSNDTTRDYLFSANFATNIGFAGVGSFIAGQLAVRAAEWLGVAAGSLAAYRVVFLVAAVGLCCSLLPLVWLRRVTLPQVRRAPDAEPAPPAQSPMAPLAGGVASGWWVGLVRRVPAVRLIPEPWHSLLYAPWQILRLMISPFLISCGAALLIPYLNLYFVQRYGMPDDQLGTTLAALGLTSGVAALLAPLLSERLGTMRAIVLVQVLSLPFLVLLGSTSLLWLAVPAAVLRQGFFNMASPLYDAFAMQQTSDALRPTAIAAVNGSFAVAYLVMPLISTSVQARYGFAPLFVVTGMCYTAAIIANLVLFVLPEQHQQPGGSAGSGIMQ